MLTVGAVVALVLAAGLVWRVDRPTAPGSASSTAPSSAPPSPTPPSSGQVPAEESARVVPATAEAGRYEAADSGNTPPALLSLLEPGAAQPEDDRAPITLVVSPPAPPDTAKEPPPVTEPPASVGALPESPAMAATVPAPQTVATPEVAPDTRPELPAEAAVLSPPIVLRAAWFSYPEAARRRRSEGNVDVRILVDTGGGVAAVTIEQGAADSTLNVAALDAARTMKFRPAHRGGTPVAVWFNYRFTFALPS